MASAFAGVETAPPIEVFNVGKKCRECTAPDKVDLGVGAYRDDNGQPWVLPVVSAAEKALANDSSINHEYLPVLGFAPFTEAATKLVLGDDSVALKEGRAFGVQALSGTGSLRLGAEFLAQKLKRTIVYASNPTWGNHIGVFKQAGFQEVRQYRYWDSSKLGLDFAGMLADIEAAPEQSVFILHGCAHNPTGCDPTLEQWKQISDACLKRKHMVFFDIAYQGFASGDPDRDAAAIRLFVNEGHELFIAQSFAKNMGLYNERVGNLCVVVRDKATIEPVKSQLSILVRANWSNPPAHGARIVAMILNDPEMRKQWHSCIQQMSSRIKTMRQQLRDRLVELKTPGTWDHIVTQIGMFSYLGVNERQVAYLTDKHHLFLLKSGRISVCGLNAKNVNHVAEAVHDAVVNASKL